MKSSGFFPSTLAALLLAVGLVHCSSTPSNPDAAVTPDARSPSDGQSPSDVQTPLDAQTPSDVAGVDAAVDATAPNLLYTHCATSADCGAGGICLTGFPRGLCARTCTGTGSTTVAGCRGPNAEPGTCIVGTPFGVAGNVCVPTCTVPTDADPGLECDNLGTSARCKLSEASTSGVCLPSCVLGSTDDPCVMGLTCDPYSATPGNGACAMTPVTTGALDGHACAASTDCRSGVCVPEVSDTGSYTGWTGGSCVSIGRQPTNAELETAVGHPLPQSSCPAGTVAYPVENEGGEAYCLQACTATSTCRPGYACDRLLLTSGAPAFTVGGCVPGNCLAAPEAAGYAACPSAYHCVATMQGPLPDGGAPPALGHCEP